MSTSSERILNTICVNPAVGGGVAALCGLERTHLYRKLRTLGIDVKQVAG